MRGSLLSSASAFTLIVVTAHVVPAHAQEETTTSSYGERSEFVEVNEYGNGSTTYSANIFAEIGGEQITVAGLSRYFVSYDPSEIEQAVPGSFGYMYQNVPVTIDAWSSPELTDSWYEVIDSFSYDTYSWEILGVVTVQTTSGDGPDPFVPIGSRGGCWDDGLSGSTNFGNFDGTFATCEGAEDYVAVAPGSVNVNTHSTTIYRDVHYHFESVDDAYTDFYVVRPAASSTASWGTMVTTLSSTTSIRNDRYATQIIGVAGGETLFDETFETAYDDAAVQLAVESLTRPRGHAFSGAPAVVVWSAPELTGRNEELLSSSTETLSNTQTFDVVTITQTQGGAVFIGDLGACTSTGTSGPTSGASPAGSFAACEGGVSYVLANGEANTNTHTTLVTETTVDTIITEDWLTAEAYAATGTPVFIGQIHSAVRDALFAASGNLARWHGDALASRQGRELGSGLGSGLGMWADVFTGETERDTDSAGPGSRYSPDGVVGGISFALSGIASLGVAASHESGDSRLEGLSEGAELSQTQLGVAAQLAPGAWRFVVTAEHGWADIETERGNDGLGGTAHADYDADTWHASGEAGREFGLGLVTLRPFAALDWSDATLDGFTESGALALAGDDDSATRLAASLGTRLSASPDSPDGPGIRLWAEARVGQVINGEERDRAVAFTGAPGVPLQVTSADEDETWAEGRIGISVYTARGLGVHLGGEGRTDGGWAATAGISAAL